MIVKITVDEAIRLGFNETYYDLFLCGSVAGDYVGEKVHIDMNQNMPSELRKTIEREIIDQTNSHHKQKDKT